MKHWGGGSCAAVLPLLSWAGALGAEPLPLPGGGGSRGGGGGCESCWSAGPARAVAGCCSKAREWARALARASPSSPSSNAATPRARMAACSAGWGSGRRWSGCNGAGRVRKWQEGAACRRRRAPALHAGLGPLGMSPSSPITPKDSQPLRTCNMCRQTLAPAHVRSGRREAGGARPTSAAAHLTSIRLLLSHRSPSAPTIQAGRAEQLVGQGSQPQFLAPLRDSGSRSFLVVC